MSSDNGLIGSAAFRKPGVPYYLENVPQPTLNQPILVAPITLKSFDNQAAATMSIGGFQAGAAYPYTGAINMSPGASSLGAAADGLTVRAVAGGAQVEVGTNGQATNNLMIAGASGLSRVYDETYNQPVALQPITKVQTSPTIIPSNPEEILRGGQAAIAAAIAGPGTVFNIFTVPRSGAYMIQTEVYVGNAGAANTVAIPSTLVGGVPIWKSISLSFQVQGTVNAVPYASFEVIGGDFYADQAFANQSGVSKTYTSLAILQAGTQYAVTLNAEAGWNIGDGGQIKTELIAMC